MKSILLYSFFSILILVQIKSQDLTQENEISIKFSGFIKSDAFYDTRQTVSAREGFFHLYPSQKTFDNFGEDINATSSFNILSIQTRLKAAITGPKAFGAKTNAVIEGAFFGNIENDINGFRLRHAFLQLDWENTSFLIGQYWNPMFIPEVYPGTISFNTGVPFQPFSRNPQLRLSHKFGMIKLIFAASSQRDFASMGPAGVSSIYLRNSSLPIFDLHIQFKTDKFFAGAGVNAKSLAPREVTDSNYAADEKINSFSVMGYSKYSSEKFSASFEAVYGGNLYDMLMLGGYAVSGIDLQTDKRTYSNINVLSLWTDISYGSEFAVAIFGGYTEQYGSSDIIVGPIYSRGSNIKALYRISPRVVYNSGKSRFALEIEHTAAMYGTVTNKANIVNSSGVSNTRILLSNYYFF